MILPNYYQINITDMRNIICSAFFILVVKIVNAQSVSPKVVAASGDYFKTGAASISYTVGEVAVVTYSVAGITVCEGFQQSFDNTSGIYLKNIDLFSVKVYPNPISDNLNIYLANNNDILEADILDIQGRILMHKNIERFEPMVSFNFTELPSTLYLLKIYKADGSENVSKKIQKIY